MASECYEPNGKTWPQIHTDRHRRISHKSVPIRENLWLANVARARILERELTEQTETKAAKKIERMQSLSLFLLFHSLVDGYAALDNPCPEAGY